jgi:uncharacterized protein YjbI with pentapeptide repeats
MVWWWSKENRMSRTPAPKPPRAPSAEATDHVPEGELERSEVYTDVVWRDLTLNGEDGVSLKQARLENVNWREQLMRRLDLTDVHLQNVDLSNARWEHLGAERVVLEACRLTGFALLAARLKDARLADCQARFAQFEKAGLKRARFERCVFTEANFNGADLQGAVFIGCDLHHATFSGANLVGCDFRESNLESSRVAIGELTGAIVTPSQAVALMQRFGGVDVQDPA